MPAARNVFAVLVHERPDCVADLVRNLRHLDPGSQVLLYNGGGRTLLNGFDLEGVVIHPSPRRMEWGRLHGFALDCMRFALEHWPELDTLTIVDSDQLAARPGWSEHLGSFLENRPRIGMLGSSPLRQPLDVKAGPALMAYLEIDLWRSWLQQFPDGEDKFVHWTFWPSTVFTAAAARDLVRIFDEDAGLHEILRQSRIWATEEILLPTLVALLGYEIAASPGSYDYVQFRQEYTAAQIAGALERPDVFWIHPVPRRLDDPLRRTIRERWNGYESPATPVIPLVSCIMPTRNRRELVPQAIRQFLRQDWPNAELIVVDDGVDKVADLIPPDPRIRYLALDERRTIGAKRNLACEAARGEIILHWDDDDWMADWRIRYQVEHLISSEADLSGLPRIYFHEPATGGTWEFTSPARHQKWIAGATFCYRKDLWRANPFEDVDVGEDMRFLWNGPPKKVSQLGDPGFYVARLHPGNTSSKRDTGRAWRRVSDRVLADVLEEEEQPAAPVATVAVTSSPLVSCIMPTRDRKELALQAIEYFQRQDWPERELVIVDDGAEPLPVPADDRIRCVRLPAPASIGHKRNLAVEQSRGEILVHWDDDDWYAPDRIRHQIQPLLTGEADVAGLTAEHFYSLTAGAFWSCTPQLHARMFFADVHGRSIAYARRVWGKARYPDLSLAEDARFLQAALQKGSRLARRPNPDKFVYVRHGANTWQFECGEFLQPEEWKAREVPEFLPVGDLAFYRGLSA